MNTAEAFEELAFAYDDCLEHHRWALDLIGHVPDAELRESAEAVLKQLLADDKAALGTSLAQLIISM
jgi:hypothetical protein